jgi:uncharacterized phage protein (TIGR02218 family)
MSYDTPESSVDQGQPYFLYLLDNGVTPVRLTSDPVTLTRMGEDWLPSSIAHADIEQTGNIEKNSVELTFPLSDTYAKTLLTPASEVTTVTVWRGHHTDLSEELRSVWKGRIVDAKSAKQNIKISVESVFTSMRRPGCRARYQRTCRHALYFPAGCNLNIADFEVAATVTVANGLVLTIPAAASQPDGYYKAGVVDFDGLFGWIGDHTGGTITLIGIIDGLADYVTAHGSAPVSIAPGCDLSETTCANKFSNSLNYGGFKNMSDNNPFSQSIT